MPAPNNTNRLFVTKDAWCNQTSPNTNYGAHGRSSYHGEQNLTLSAETNNQKRIYIEPPYPAEARAADNKITTAKLHLRQGNPWPAGTHTLTVTILAETWVESSINWTNKPSVRAEPAASLTFEIAGGQPKYTAHELELANLYNEIKANGWTVYSFEIKVDTSGNKGYYSSDLIDAHLHPFIEWAWDDVSDIPHDLSPNGTCSTGGPAFSADLGRVADSWTIQVATDADFTNIIRTKTQTGWTSAHLNYVSSGDGTWVSLPTNATYYWRCRCTANGRTSAWSEATEFAIKTKATITNVSPAAGVTNDTSPAISYTYTPGQGGAQIANYIEIRRWDGGQYAPPHEIPITTTPAGPTGRWVDGWKRDWTATSSTSVTVPTGVLKSGYKYMLIIRVKDSVERDDCPTDRYFVQASTIWLLDEDYATSPVSTLTAVQRTRTGACGNPPIVDLAWTRTATPDRYRVMRRYTGDPHFTILADKVAADFKHGTDDYRWADYGTSCGKEVIYRVDAIVGGKASKQQNADPFFEQGMDQWTLSTNPPAVASVTVEHDKTAPSGHYLWCEINNGGTNWADIGIYQDLFTASINQVVTIKTIMRSHHNDTRTVRTELRRTTSPYTVYGSSIFTVVGDVWTTDSYTVTIPAAVPVTVSATLGTNSGDVDIAEILVEWDCVDRLTPSTRGWWIMSDDGQAQVPIIGQEEISADSDQGESEALHPIGGKFVKVSTPKIADKWTISGILNETDGRDYLDQLKAMQESNELCWAISHHGLVIPCVVNTVKKTAYSVPILPIWKVDVELLEVDADV